MGVMNAYRMFLVLLGTMAFGACGGTDSGVDGGTDGASNDGTASDVATDSSGPDASTDSPTQDVVNADSPTSDGGGLGVGASCDPHDDMCMAGLKCCPGGTILFDSGPSYHCMMVTTMGTCPIVP